MSEPPNDSLLLGLDIGGTKCAVLIGTRRGDVLARRQWPSQVGRGAEAMIADLLVAAGEMVAAYPKVAAVGISIGGPMDARRGIIKSPPNLPGWDEVPLKQIVSERLGLPVRVEHDAAACALAEYHWGASRGRRRLAYLTCATGFGAGLIFDGEPYYGPDGESPEIGHVLLQPDGPEAYGLAGSTEAFCSAKSLGRLAHWKFPQRWPAATEPRDIAALAAAGDAQAGEIIEINAAAVGRVCALLADLLRVDAIVLGSLAAYLGEGWVERVRCHCRRLSLPDASACCHISAAMLGERLQDCSALVPALRLI